MNQETPRWSYSEVHTALKIYLSDLDFATGEKEIAQLMLKMKNSKVYVGDAETEKLLQYLSATRNDIAHWVRRSQFDRAMVEYAARLETAGLKALTASATSQPEVPKWAENVLYFILPKKARETAPGDLAEEFNIVIVPKMGRTVARVWYWWQVIVFALRALIEHLWPIARSVFGR